MKNTYVRSTAKSENQFSIISNRIRFSLVAFLLVAFSFSMNAQVSSYPFAASAGTYTPITGGTVLGVPATNDDLSFNSLPIGFTFCFNGVSYTTFSANCNGFIALGNTVANSYTAISTGATNNIISAFNFDLESDATTGDFQYTTLGTSPNRTLVVQWTNFDAWQAATNTDVYNFQIRLNETSNNIEVVYGNFTCNAAARLAQVGLRGNSNADFNNLEVSNGVNTWATPTAGLLNSTVCEANNSPLIPTSGQTYTWSSPTPTVAPLAITFTGVTSTAMTVNWNDNSTNESGFTVQRSLDNIIFTNVSVIPSTSIPTTGTPYLYNASGLFSNTLYYWRIIANNANCSNPFVAGNQTTLSGTMCGTYTIGPTGAYTSITAAVAAVAINGILCPLTFELQAAYVSTVETFPIVIPFLGAGPTTSITCRPELGATNLSITSAATQTIDFSGSTYFTFDGRPGGVGVIRQLTIANTVTAGNAARFINGTSNNGFNYCNIRGVNTTTTNGVVLFSTASATDGNSNNSITNCDLYDNGTFPANLIYSSNATPLIFNSGNIISNNTFHDWFLATGQTAAISIQNGNNAWTISNNSFYQTATRTYTLAATHYGILINSTTALTGGYIVTGNFIGGNAALCGGTPYTVNGAVASRFIGINLTATAGGTSSIQGNTIKNFNFTTTSGATTINGIWCGINLTGTGASTNVGTVTPNVIGSNSVNAQIVTSCSTTGGMTVGINSSATGAVSISNNQIGGITANSSSGTISSSIYGIQTSGAGTILNITNNSIGSSTLASSFINSISTSATGGHITGILSSCTGTSVISGNTIMNFTNQYGGASTTGQVRGITVTSGANTISGNTIGAMANLSPQIGTGTLSAVLGINCSSTIANQVISLNTISGLASGSIAGAVKVNGINYSGATTGTNAIFRNTISALASASSGVAVISGINITAGVASYYNNFINIGVDITGASLTASHEYNGIFKSAATNNKFYYNSVSVAGSGVAAGSANSYAFRRTGTGVDTLKNNILYNNRSNGASTGFHFSVSLNNSTTYIANTNDIYGAGTGYVLGEVTATPYATLSAWSAATLQDGSSYSVNPTFISATNLHINNAAATALESRGVVITGIANDIDNDARPGPIGSVNGGGILPDIGADEFDGIPLAIDMGVSAIWRPAISGCHGASDSVTFVIRNYSSITINFLSNPVTVNSSVTGPNPMAFPPFTVNSGTLIGNGTMNVTVSTTYNMTAVGTYGFIANTSTAGDAVPSNDALASVNITISGGTVVSSVSSICIGANATMTASGYTNGGSIQWQDSPDNITFTNIASATNPTLSVSPTDTMFYRVVICGLHNSTSDTLNVIIVNSPTTVGATRCGAGPVTMTASGSGTLNWFDAATAGNQVNSGTSFTTTIPATTTYYVEASSGTPPSAHTTTFLAGNGQAGTMFTITAINTVTITSFDGHVITGGNSSWRIDYRPNDYLLVPGANTSAVGWLPLGTATNVASAGTGLPTPIPIAFNITIPAGQTYSFHVMTTAGTGVQYTNGTLLGAVYNANADFQFIQGHGGTPFNCTFAPRVFNGRIHYQSGCASARTPVTATITPAPAITAVAASTSLCDGDSVQLSVTSGNGSYGYTWSPAAFLSATTGSSVMSGPPTPGSFTYYVDAFDSGTGCAIRDTVNFSVNPIPTVTATVDNDTVCSGTAVNLGATQPPTTVVVSNGNVLNTATTYPAPYGNWYGGARHQMLIRASELTAAGLTAGYLGGLQFQVTNTNAADPLMNLTISLGLTGVTALTATFEVLPMTQVYTNASYVPTVGVNTHTFSTLFFWDGVSNIMVETCFLNQTSPTTTSFTNNATMRHIVTPFNSTNYFFADDDMTVCSAATGTVIAQRPNIAFIRSFSTWAYAWTPTIGVTNPNAQNTSASPNVTTTYIVTVTDTTSGCSKSDSVRVVVNPSPMPMLGNDTAICSNTSLILDASAGAYSYLWSDASTNQTLTVSTFGNYDVFVTDIASGCTGRDTILVGINAAPTFSLGSDAVICAGNSVTFSGPGGQFNYDWSTLDTTQAISTGIGGSYILVLTDTINACFNSDTVALTVNPVPSVALGSDYAICSANAPAILVAPGGAYTYLWSDASTDDSLFVTASGSYYVSVTDTATSCYSGDTISVTINSTPIVSLGVDSTFCSGSGPITLSSPAGPFDYLWSDASTNMTLTTNTTGVYDVTVTDSITGCSAVDTVSITVNASPIVNLGADTNLCGGTITLDAQNAGSSYVWSDLSVAQTLTATATGNYYVDVTATNGCAATDSIMVTINTAPSITFTPQSSACSTDPDFILVGSPTGGTFSGPGVTGNTFSPSGAGVGPQTVTYFYTDTNGCSGSVDAVITVNACVGVTEPFVAAGMKVFPNPNNGTFTLTINDADYTEITMELMSVDGKVISSDMASNVKGVYVKQLDLSTQANGVYFLRVTANGQNFMQKIVKHD